MASCTNKVGNHEAPVNMARNEQQNKEESVSFVLKSNDTPGVADSQGRCCFLHYPEGFSCSCCFRWWECFCCSSGYYLFWQALPIIVTLPSITVSNRLSSFFTAPSRLKTLFSRVQGARKPVQWHRFQPAGLNLICPPILIGKFYTIFIELKILLVKHTRMLIADSERAWKVGLTFWADQTRFKSFWKFGQKWPII